MQELDLGELGVRLHHKFRREGRVVIVILEALIEREIVLINTPLEHVIEEGRERIKVLCRDGVKLVIMTLGTARGLPQKSLTDGTDAVRGILCDIFLGLDPPFTRHHPESIETSRDELLGGGIFQQITRKLLGDEFVERLVLIEGLDDVIAIRKNSDILIAVVADGVGKTNDIEPRDRHALTESGALKETGDFRIKGSLEILSGCLFKSDHFGRCGRETGEIKRKASEKLGGLRARRRLDFFLLKLGENEGIDRIFSRRCRCWLFDRSVGPVRFILRALLDPLPEEFALSLGDMLVEMRRRHDIVLVPGVDALEHFRLGRIARPDREQLAIRAQRSGRPLKGIEAQLSLPLFRIRSVAGDAFIRENTPDMGIVSDFLRL